MGDRIENDPEQITVESLYGARTDAPLVKLKAGPHQWIFPPEKARQIAQWLVEAAEASYGDAFLVRWIMQEIKVPREAAVPILREFRAFRELSRRQGLEHEEADQAQWQPEGDQ